MVEGGRIDHAHHAGNAARALEDTVAFDAAIKMALEMTNREDTLIVVTADHSHTMTINGYPEARQPDPRRGRQCRRRARARRRRQALHHASATPTVPGAVFPPLGKDEDKTTARSRPACVPT